LLLYTPDSVVELLHLLAEARHPAVLSPDRPQKPKTKSEGNA
jgi:hypothetical protein